MLLALLAGLGMGTLFVVLAELFDHIYRSSTHVAQSLGLPILETIDEIVTAADRRKLLIKRAVIVPVAVCMCMAITGTTGALAYLSLERPHTYKRIVELRDRAANLFALVPMITFETGSDSE